MKLQLLTKRISEMLHWRTSLLSNEFIVRLLQLGIFWDKESGVSFTRFQVIVIPIAQILRWNKFDLLVALHPIFQDWRTALYQKLKGNS